MRTIGQAFDVVHRIVEHEKDQNNNDEDQTKLSDVEVLASPKKSIKSNKVKFFTIVFWANQFLVEFIMN